MTTRQHSLTEQQAHEVTRRLSMHRLSNPQATSSFIESVNSYLSITDTVFDEIDEYTVQTIKIIIRHK